MSNKEELPFKIALYQNPKRLSNWKKPFNISWQILLADWGEKRGY